MKQLAALSALALVLAVSGAPPSSARSADCKPVRAVFYESSDWARVATGLAANPSPCADYYITIPALAASKTQMRPAAAAQVRALGSNFHAIAEINYTAWKSWVASTGNSWYQAGVEARQRMAATGFNITAGDTWVVNEFPSTVRAGTGTARQDVRDLVRGLYYGDGSQPTAKGMVFVVGVGQTGVSFPTYKATLQSWFQDQNFWDEMTSYVSDFFQEAYGDVRNYAVAGADPTTRANALNGFLQYPLSLAQAPGAPPAEVGARNYLASAYGALANASWAWGSAYGYTKVGSDVMADYISAQTYAMRLTGSARIGFAWNPLNTMGLTNDDFVAQVGAVLARLAGSIHETDGGNAAAACVSTGCASVLPDAKAVTGWNTFSTWAPTTAAFSSPPVNVPTAAVAGPISLRLKAGTANTSLPVPSTVTVTSSSRTGTFAASADGPWLPSLTLTLPPGTGTATFFAQDTTGGTPTFTASIGGQTATQAETIVAPAPPPVTTTTTTPSLPPVEISALSLVPENGHMHLSLTVTSGDGQPLQARVSLALLRETQTIATTTAFTNTAGELGVTARPKLALGCYSARVSTVGVAGYLWDRVVPSTTFCVRTLPLHVSAIAFGRKNGRLHVGVRVTDDSGRPLQARVAFDILRGSTAIAGTSGRTRSDGWLGVTARPKLVPGCYRVTVRGASAPGYAWDRVTPTRSYCVR